MTRTERQELALKRWKEAGFRGVFEFCTGLGKTRCALMAIEKLSSRNPSIKVLIVVPTKVLKEQWKIEISKFPFTSIFQYEIQVLNTAAKKKQSCDFLILDECHVCNSLIFSKLFNNIKYKLILGLTATYERLDEREKLIMDKYCPVCDSISLKEATENGWVAPHITYKVMLDVDLSEYERANQQFIQHFSFFDFDFKLATQLLASPILLAKYAKQKGWEVKDVKIHLYAWNKALQFRKSFIANHPKKLEIAKRIIEARSDKKIITFNSSIKMCNEYNFGYVVSSEQTKKQNKAIIEEFNNIESGVLHTSKMCNAGVDIKGLSVGIRAGYTSSKIDSQQSEGRICRFEPGKKAEMFYLVLRDTVENRWFSKNMEGREFVLLNEEELDEVLEKGFINKQEQIQQVSKYNMRY